MGFKENIEKLGQRSSDLVNCLKTEEATKTSLVMPFIQVLGYDVFNPEEVVPEYTTDVGMKKGEKVDYAILREKEIVILIECKKAGVNLSVEHANQLYRYFAVTKAKIAILTNGTDYLFYTDIDEPNKMDARPFLTFDLTNPRGNIVDEIRKLTKDRFDSKQMIGTASKLKYTSEIKRVFNQQLEEPDNALVKFFFTRIHPDGRFTSTASQRFSSLVKSALVQFINERVSSRLQSALADVSSAKKEVVEIINLEDDGIVTTEEEIEGYHIVKAIVSEVVDPDRVIFRDTKSYMGVLLDDNRLKPICRLHFNTANKYIGLFDETKKEGKVAIDALSDIYKHANNLKKIVKIHDGGFG